MIYTLVYSFVGAVMRLSYQSVPKYIIDDVDWGSAEAQVASNLMDSSEFLRWLVSRIGKLSDIGHLVRGHSQVQKSFCRFFQSPSRRASRGEY